MHKRPGFLSLLTVGAATVVLMAGADTPSVSRSPLDLLGSADVSENLKGRQMILADRKQLIENLLEIVNRDDGAETDLMKRWFMPKRTALELIGELRPDDDKTIQALAKHLKFEVEPFFGGYGTSRNLSFRYPAVGALVRIGHPSLKFAWYRVQMSDDALERELCAWIIGQVEGGQTARLLMDRRIEKADFVSKPRFEAARKHLEKVSPTGSQRP